MSSLLQNGQHILFIGDSITDCGRRESHAHPLGNGYVRFLADLLVAREPEKAITVTNRGISGNKIDDLRDRWVDDALSHRPDVLVVKIGINDLNGFLRGGEERWGPVPYEKNYRALLEAAKVALPTTPLLLISPFYISRETNSEAYRQKVLALLPEYIAVVKRMSEDFGARFLDLHTVFQAHLKYRHPDAFCPEPVHPNATGHWIMAEAVYEALSA